MLRKNISKAKSVSDKINETLSRHVDANDNSSEESDEAPRVEQGFNEYEQPSAVATDIRKQNIKLLSEENARYRGKISSRNKLETDSSNVDTDNNEDLESTDNEATTLSSEKIDSSEEGSNYDEDMEYWDVDSNEEYEGSIIDYNDDETLNNVNSIISKPNQHAEIQKGQCVQNQLLIWERLLEVRIHTQKLISKANKLQAPLIMKAQIMENEQLASARQLSVKNVGSLLHSLIELQSNLYRQNPELSRAMKNTLKRPLTLYKLEEDDTPPLKQLKDNLDSNFQEQKAYRNAVLMKWYDRTRLLTPGAGAKKKSFTEDFDIIQKIESALQNRNALIEKSQIQTDCTIGKEIVTGNSSDTPMRNPEIFDDSDFYHQQLRELIEYKTNTSSNAKEVTQQYIELQKLRQKMKKAVDTRASKGRKLRYAVHKKLINFMAPDNVSTWTDESKDELYRSLFAA